jgi:cysteine-rich repeat protein
MANLDLRNILASRTVAVHITTPGQSITATTSTGPGGACAVDTAILLRDSTFMPIAVYHYDASFGPCAGIPFPDAAASDLAVGTYYLETFVEGMMGGNVTMQVGVLNPRCGDNFVETRANEQCDDGNNRGGDGCSAVCRFEGMVPVETEPNNTYMQAVNTHAVIGAAKVTVQAAISPATDIDYFFFDVPAGRTATLVAQTYTQRAAPSVCVGADTLLHLQSAANAAGGMTMELTSNDDANGTLCSMIDGGTDTAAANLPAGRYYLWVEAYMGQNAIPTYFLDVTLR